MSDLLDTRVDGDPAACTAAAGGAAAVREAVADAEQRIGTARSLAGSWRGQAGVAFELRADAGVRDCRELADRIGVLERALTDFAGELTAVRERMVRAREVAAAGGVPVHGTDVARPPSPGAASQAQLDLHERRVEAWNEAVAIAADARAKEQEAHQQLGDQIARSTGDGFLADLLERLGLLPPDYPDSDDVAAWLFGLGGLGFGAAASWYVHGRYGVFQPRVKGRFASAAGMSFWERARAAGRSDSFHAKPNTAATRNRWVSASRWAGGAGVAVTVLSTGWNQWQADADDPSLGTAERAGRAGTQAVSTAGGAWVGAQGGAWAGGAIGTAICPGVGTVVGGVVGGLLGGAAGAFAGSKGGELLVDPVGDIVDTAADWAGDAADAVGDTLSDAGDALTFWD